MSSTILRSSRALCTAHGSRIVLARPTRLPIPARHQAPTPIRVAPALFHSSRTRLNSRDEERNPTNFGELDVLGNAPIPATSVDVCTYDGFHLNSGARITGGDGVLLIAGEAFRWRPWIAKGSKELVNAKWQWDVPAEAFGALSLLWPRPDLLILGLGPELRPISRETRKHISNLGMRVEILDTRNAASQFNLLATERGVDDVAAALIPIGWKDGKGVV